MATHIDRLGERARAGIAWTGQTIAEFKAEKAAMEAGRYPE